MIETRFDIFTFILYSLMAILGYLFFFLANKNKDQEGNRTRRTYFYYLIWGVIWVVFAAFRYVSYEVGGTDAPNYIEYFNVCLSGNVPEYYAHYDLVFRIFTQAIRIFTSSHYIYFIIIYGIIFFSYIFFLDEYTPDKSSFIPYILTFFVYLRGFNTIRTNLAVAVILIGLTFFSKKKYIPAVAFVCFSILLQKASAVYVLILPFLYLAKRFNFKLKHYSILLVASIVIGKISQYILLYVIGDHMNGAYSSYARRSLYTSFFDNYWKIVIDILLLAAAIIIFYRPVRNDIDDSNGIDKYHLNLIWIYCMFDILIIPLTYILSIWRGYEYLYIIRLVMWGEIIKVFRNKYVKKEWQKYFDLLCIVVFLGWFFFRFYNTYQSSKLSPYFFGPFVN